MNAALPPVLDESTEPSPTTQPPGVWRHGQMLVFAKGAELPPLCLDSGEPAADYMVESWLWKPYRGRGIVAGVVGMFEQQRADVRYGMGQSWINRRTNATWAAVGVWAIGIPLAILICVINSFVAGPPAVYGVCFLGTLAACLISAVVASMFMRTIQPIYMDESFVWVDNMPEAYLKDLPPWPGPAPV